MSQTPVSQPDTVLISATVYNTTGEMVLKSDIDGSRSLDTGDNANSPLLVAGNIDGLDPVILAAADSFCVRFYDGFPDSGGSIIDSVHLNL